MRFDGVRVLIVGAASGLGAACARAFAREGARLVLADQSRDALERISAAVGGRAFSGDATCNDFATEVVAAADAEILVHTAGIDPASATTVPGTDPGDWDRIMAVNLGSAFLFSRAVLPGMIARGRGNILLTGSVGGLRALPAEAAYAVSKAGLIHLARCIALDHAAQGVRANALCPGFLEAVMQDRAGALSDDVRAARHAMAKSLVPMGREGRYQELAALAVTLCDDSVSGYMTGQAVVADGGLTLR